jgi:hypothetical protein
MFDKRVVRGNTYATRETSDFSLETSNISRRLVHKCFHLHTCTHTFNFSRLCLHTLHKFTIFFHELTFNHLFLELPVQVSTFHFKNVKLQKHQIPNLKLKLVSSGVYVTVHI